MVLGLYRKQPVDLHWPIYHPQVLRSSFIAGIKGNNKSSDNKRSWHHLHTIMPRRRGADRERQRQQQLESLRHRRDRVREVVSQILADRAALKVSFDEFWASQTQEFRDSATGREYSRNWQSRDAAFARAAREQTRTYDHLVRQVSVLEES